MMIRLVLLLPAVVAAAPGCSRRPARVMPPAVQPAVIAAKAIELYDENGDGQLQADEMSPGIKALLKTADSDKNGILTRQEITDRLQEHVASDVGLQDVGGLVSYQGRTLAGATVRFIPEPAFEGVIEPASGVCDASGYVSLGISDHNLPGIQPGLYSLQVSIVEQGVETLPTRFNSETELGEEVGPQVQQGGWSIKLE